MFKSSSEAVPQVLNVSLVDERGQIRRRLMFDCVCDLGPQVGQFAHAIDGMLDAFTRRDWVGRGGCRVAVTCICITAVDAMELPRDGLHAIYRISGQKRVMRRCGWLGSSVSGTVYAREESGLSTGGSLGLNVLVCCVVNVAYLIKGK